MGELQDYYIVLSEIKFNDDPMKYGRIRCDIPGVIHSANISTEAYPDAMPWIRPFKMQGYQTFSKPLVGQKVWVLISKTNYNEFWWFPYHETLDFVQQFIEENYDNQPDVFNAREGSGGEAIFTYDDEHGYIMRLGEDYMNLKPDRTMKVAFNDCRIMIDGNKVYTGKGDPPGEYEKCVKGFQCQKMRSLIAGEFQKLAERSLAGDNGPLSEPFGQIAQHLGMNILGENHYVN